MRGHLARHLFDFAILSDSHVNEAEERSLSPYPCNRLANGRLRWVVREINRHRPAFTLHLGDMGNPLPELPAYPEAAALFKSITGELEAPLYCIPGNHCVGDKPRGWVPVPRVSNKALRDYEQHYGEPRYSFDHGPCHFVGINSLLFNSGLRREQEQRRWLERDLAAAAAEGKRLWVMMHYPLFVAVPDEADSYDNLGEPGRSWLLELLERHRVEAVYSGHVHNYFYNRYGDTHLYTLPATSFVRHDYSEIFRVAPADDQGGRDDVAKLGYGIVRVYENGHAVQILRTLGRVRGAEDKEEEPARIEPVSARERTLAPVGVEMRENWLSQKALRANNSVSPFTRRPVRNDWALLALQEMGVRRIRVARQELDKEDVLDRMATLQAAGYEFVLYSHGIPGEREYRVVRKHRALLAGWELVLGLDQIESVARGVARLESGLSSETDLPCYLNEVHDVSAARIDDANVKHVANYGFQLHEADKILRLSRSPAIREAFAGLVFRLRRRDEQAVTPWEAIGRIRRMGEEHGMRHQVHLLFSGNVTAEAFVDDLATANRVAEATLAAVAAGNVDLFLDTFEDVDRGYFVRNGLVDRRYNPRPAARVVRHLNAALARYDAWALDADTALAAGTHITCLAADRLLALVMPRPRLILHELVAPKPGGWKRFTLVDLDTGAVSSLEAATSGSRIDLAAPLIAEGPLLVIGEP